MKYEIMLGILFTLLDKRKVRAQEVAKKFGCSVRSVYRYIDEMTASGVPIDVVRGARGGFTISDCYKLPKGLMNREEYERTLDALLAFRDQFPDGTTQSAIDKLTARVKEEKFDLSLSGNILVDSGTWGDERKFSEKLTLLETAIEKRRLLDLSYIDRGGEESRRKIKPLLLVYKQNIWYLYAFCLLRDDFRLFKIGRMKSIFDTGETFEPVEFSREALPLSFWKDEKTVEARFEIAPAALPYAEEWLGVENVKSENGKLVADVSLPDDGALIGKLLSMGSGFKVIYPEALKERVKQEAERLADMYA